MPSTTAPNPALATLNNDSAPLFSSASRPVSKTLNIFEAPPSAPATKKRAREENATETRLPAECIVLPAPALVMGVTSAIAPSSVRKPLSTRPSFTPKRTAVVGNAFAPKETNVGVNPNVFAAPTPTDGLKRDAFAIDTDFVKAGMRKNVFAGADAGSKGGEVGRGSVFNIPLRRERSGI